MTATNSATSARIPAMVLLPLRATTRLYAAIDRVELEAAGSLTAARALAQAHPHVQPPVRPARGLEAPHDARALARDLLLVDQQPDLRLQHAPALERDRPAADAHAVGIRAKPTTTVPASMSSKFGAERRTSSRITLVCNW